MTQMSLPQPPPDARFFPQFLWLYQMWIEIQSVYSQFLHWAHISFGIYTTSWHTNYISFLLSFVEANANIKSKNVPNGFLTSPTLYSWNSSLSFSFDTLFPPHLNLYPLPWFSPNRMGWPWTSKKSLQSGWKRLVERGNAHEKEKHTLAVKGIRLTEETAVFRKNEQKRASAKDDTYRSLNQWLMNLIGSIVSI